MSKTILEKIADHRAAITEHETAIADLKRNCEHQYVIERQQAHSGLDGSRTFTMHMRCTLCESKLIRKGNPLPECVHCKDVAMQPVSEKGSLSGEEVTYRCPLCDRKESNFWHLYL